VNQANVGSEELVESYVGVDFSILYECALLLIVGTRVIKQKEDFYCSVPGQGIQPEVGKRKEPKNFKIDPSTLEGSSVSSVPKFLFEGFVDSTNCGILNPVDGMIVVRESEMVIRSVETQLIRVETFEGKTNPTEVQNIQVADGDVIRNLEIPLYMLLPKLYSCPTIVHDKFRIEFQVNIIVIFANGYQLTENFPIRVYR
jgi:hypothetical protein